MVAYGKSHDRKSHHCHTKSTSMQIPCLLGCQPGLFLDELVDESASPIGVDGAESASLSAPRVERRLLSAATLGSPVIRAREVFSEELHNRVFALRASNTRLVQCYNHVKADHRWQPPARAIQSRD